MDKVLIERIYTTVAGLIVGLVAGYALKRGWKLATGQEPPDPNDPEVPVRSALIWFVLSSVGVGAIQLLTARTTKRHALKRRVVAADS